VVGINLTCECAASSVELGRERGGPKVSEAKLHSLIVYTYPTHIHARIHTYRQYRHTPK